MRKVYSTKVHATTVQSDLSTSSSTSSRTSPNLNNVASSIVSLKAPTIISKDTLNQSLNEVSLVKNNTSAEVDDGANSIAKIFTLNTGLSESEPTIVLSSEFIPLYEGGERSKKGKSVSLKEGSKIVNAKTAITVLAQNPEVSSSINFNRNELQNYANEENSFLGQLITRIDQILSSMDISQYSLGNNLSFKSTLSRNGYSSSDVTTFTNTKLWQQSLIETKKSIVSHTSEFISQNFSRNSVQNDSDSFKMSDIEETPNNLKKLWLNPYGIKLPTVSGISMGNISSIKDFTDYESYRFVNLKYANLEEKKIVVTGPNFISLSSAEQLFFSVQAINTFQDSGKDISILANMIFKEATFSSFLGKRENVETLQKKFGYTVNNESDNFSMWDHVIGQASKNVTDFFSYPVGNGNSLISFSQKKITQGQNSYTQGLNLNYYRVLTLENDFLEGTNTTPGSYYYVDSSLNTLDGKTFDLSRLDDLVKMTNDSRETTRMIIELLGREATPLLSRARTNSYISNNINQLTLNGRKNSNAPSISNNDSEDSSIFGENYPKKTSLKVFSLTDLVDRLSIVTQTYQNYLEFSPDDKSIERIRVEDMKASVLENKGVRLAAMLCKTLVNPVESYRVPSKNIKPLMFMWLMSIVLQQTQGSRDSGNGLLIKERITSYFKSVTTSLSETELQSAFYEARTFPVAIGTAPYSGQLSDIDQSTFDLSMSSNMTRTAELDLEEFKSWWANRTSKERVDGFLSQSTWTGQIGVDLTITSEHGVDVNWAMSEVNRYILEKTVDAANAEVNIERAAARRMYQNAASETLFEIDESKGLWRIMIDVLKSVFTNRDLYAGDVTNYSCMSKVAYMYNFFDLMLRIIAAQTPENLLGVYNSDYQYKTNNIAAANYTEDAITIHETGFLVSRVESEQLNSHYNIFAVKQDVTSPASKTVYILSDAVDFIENEERSVIHEIGLFRKYFLDLGTSINQYKTFLSNNFQSHLDKLNILFQQDESLEDKKKTSLINLTFTQGQIKLSKYYISEMSDRLSQTDEIASKIKSQPSFANFPEGFIDYMPVNETELVSYSMLSPYFKSNEFLKSKGNNKKIISVGIPPKLIQKLTTSPKLSTNTLTGLRQGLVRIKMYKLDRLHPDLVYQPQVYLFDMNRYPTRVISNWNYESFISDETNLLSVPTKLVKPDGTVILHKDYTEAFPVSLYSNYLKDEEKLQLYRNHAISFLSEEYLRWFTDTRFDDVRYNNFSKLSSTINNVEQQYQTYIDTLTNTPPTINQGSVTAQFTKKDSGKTFNIPVSRPGSSTTTTSSSDIKSYVIPMNDTMRSFFMNETFLSDTNIYKRRISYPKKFDRVFSMIIDPDDFIIDESMSTKETLDYLVSLGILTGGSLGDIKIPYRHRDTSPDDITLDEYFVTIEPYDYVQEYEG